MKSRAEVARPLSAPGALVMLMWGGCGPQRRSPTPLQSVICQEAEACTPPGQL